jgi:Uma2 family endonuclease
MATAQKLMTVEEFERLPDPSAGERMELVRGVVVLAPPADTGQGRRSFRIGRWLDDFVEAHQLGAITGEGGYLLAEDPDIVRAPDTAWLSSQKHERQSGRETGYFKGTPNLAVEVVSDGDRDVEVTEKVEDWLRYGTDRVWVVRPRQRTVTVHRSEAQPHVYASGDVLTSEDAGFPVEGFELPVGRIFE